MPHFRNKKLRKLRDTEDEDIVGGKEYEKKLRKQHAKLNRYMNTSWANISAERRPGQKFLDVRHINDFDDADIRAATQSVAVQVVRVVYATHNVQTECSKSPGVTIIDEAFRFHLLTH